MPQLMGRALELLKTVKTGEPILNLNRSVAAETLWPATLEIEADKAASILRSFFLDGFIVPYRTLGKCPQHMIRNCRAIAVFHVLRASLHSPSDSGSGIFISRLHAGQWSNASAIVVDLELPEDVDVADMVVVVNNQEDLEAISRQAQSPGKGLKIEPGPIPQSDAYAARMRKAPGETTTNFFYAKSKGQLRQLDLKNLVIRAADGENERFYGVPGVSVEEILSGQVKSPSGASAQLNSTLTALEQQNPSLSGLPKPGNCPGDRRIRAPTATTM